jgi:predicted nucleotidyltransferase
MELECTYRDRIEVVYTPSHWKVLARLREKSIEIMDAFALKGIISGIYGSVVRGDVTPKSDIDIIIPYILSSHSVELALIRNGFKIYNRRIAQATPNSTPKAHIFLDIEEKTCVTFPLASFRTLELEFYKFGGYLELDALKADNRVPGCSKELMLIEPTEQGHMESSIRYREREIAKIVGISINIIKERSRVLKRRKKVGRTGIVLSVHLEKEAVFENILRQLAASNPIVRRRLKNE